MNSANNQFNSNNSGLNDFFEEEIDIRNLCSWLLVFSPQELAILTPILAILISANLTLEEQAVIGSFLTALADNIFLISAQQLLINSALDIQKQIIEREKVKLEKQKEEEEKVQKEQEMNDLKLKVEHLEELLNKHLKNSL